MASCIKRIALKQWNLFNLGHSKSYFSLSLSFAWLYVLELYTIFCIPIVDVAVASFFSSSFSKRRTRRRSKEKKMWKNALRRSGHQLKKKSKQCTESEREGKHLKSYSNFEPDGKTRWFIPDDIYTKSYSELYWKSSWNSDLNGSLHLLQCNMLSGNYYKQTEKNNNWNFGSAWICCIDCSGNACLQAAGQLVIVFVSKQKHTNIKNAAVNIKPLIIRYTYWVKRHSNYVWKRKMEAEKKTERKLVAATATTTLTSNSMSFFKLLSSIHSCAFLPKIFCVYIFFFFRCHELRFGY